MSIARLRRILNSAQSVQLDSSTQTILRIQQQIDKRAQSMAQKGKAAPPPKPPAVVQAVAGVNPIDIRPVDLLRKIGDLTTPSDVNMASLSASWATRRYFWAIDEPKGNRPKFRLSEDARKMDFHQKTLLSDEFGIGFGGLVLERCFQAEQAIDVSAALEDPEQYQGITQSGAPQPDYLMWNPLPNSPYYVVECKGCQTKRDVALNQIRRGLEQVPSLVFAGGRPVNTLVVATLMRVSETTVFIVDPPEPPNDDDDIVNDRSRFSERTGKNAWRINNPDEFSNVAWEVKQTKLLNWAGQFASASAVARRRGRVTLAEDAADLETAAHSVGDLRFRGRRLPLFPELGYGELRVFIGVQEDILETARSQLAPPDREAISRQVRAAVEGVTVEPNTSIGRDGTCLIVEGL